MKDLTAQWANYFNGIQQMLGDYERLQQRVAALESENAALTDTVEQWKNNDEWSNRVTYDNVVDQIASLEDASKRDDARRLIEALLMPLLRDIMNVFQNWNLSIRLRHWSISKGENRRSIMSIVTIIM